MLTELSYDELPSGSTREPKKKLHSSEVRLIVSGLDSDAIDPFVLSAYGLRSSLPFLNALVSRAIWKGG
jgi:hypothetical protein